MDFYEINPNHLPTCSPFCAVIHCYCGKPAMQGSHTCSNQCHPGVALTVAS